MILSGQNTLFVRILVHFRAESLKCVKISTNITRNCGVPENDKKKLHKILKNSAFSLRNIMRKN